MKPWLMCKSLSKLLTICLLIIVFFIILGIISNGMGLICRTSAEDVWTLEKKHDFEILIPGTVPYYTKLAEKDGKFYGMTSSGGNGSYGVIFEWDPETNVYIKKVDLYYSSGSYPAGSLIEKDGKFYGMTRSGGANGAGVIFEWDPSTNIYVKKIDLLSSNGSEPNGSLVEKDGKFYGMTRLGGANNYGVIFELDPVANVYTKKVDLSTSIGGRPYGSLVLWGDKFYGTTYSGGTNNRGVIFEWDLLTNIYTVKVNLTVSTGSYPNDSFVLKDDMFYGMTYMNGGLTYGTIFEWNPLTNVFTNKYVFEGIDGKYPRGSLEFLNGKFYGMTYNGGVDNMGVIFEWDPTTSVYTKKIELGLSLGTNPNDSLTLYNDKFYGMTRIGGANNSGVIFEWDPATDVYTLKIDFSDTVGSEPFGSLTLKDDKFYGMTYDGGANNYGVIFEWDPLTNVYDVKVDFDNTSGSRPDGSLSLLSNKFYGVTQYGGADYSGVIFEWDPVANVYTKKIDFTDSIGSYPLGSLTFWNGKFYGMTNSGGDNYWGVIFEWDPVTNIYVKKIDFSDLLGGSPRDSLVLKDDKFYGMTEYGGEYGMGVLFEWDPATNVYTKKIDFYDLTGENPSGSLLLNDSKLYGMTNSGGYFGHGVIFEWDPETDVYNKLFDLDSDSGRRPWGSLVLKDETFYGMTEYGGEYNAGTIISFRLDSIQDRNLIYDSNGATSGVVPIDLNSPYSNNSVVTVLANSGNLFKPGYLFNGWNTVSNGSGTDHGVGSTFPILSDTVLYAQWTPIAYQISFDGNLATGGTMINQGFVYDIAQPLMSNIYVREGYVFSGWNTVNDGSGDFYSDGETVLNISEADESIVTLFAQWIPVETTGDQEGDGDDFKEDEEVVREGNNLVPDDELDPVDTEEDEIIVPVNEIFDKSSDIDSPLLEKSDFEEEVNKLLGSLGINSFNLEKGADIIRLISIPAFIIISGWDLLNIPAIILQALTRVLLFLGVLKKGKRIGIIYDSATKEPLSNTIVRLYKDNRLISTTVSDIGGAYYFNIDPGTYSIEVKRFGYVFPSKVIFNEEYLIGSIYKGGKIEINEKQLFSISIPMDPTSRTITFSNFRRKVAYEIGGIVMFLWKVIVFLGFLLSIFWVIKETSVINVLSLLWYLIIVAISYFNRNADKWKYGKITHDGVGLPDIIVSAKDKEFNALKGYRRSDKNGLYNFVLPKDEYFIEVNGKMNNAIMGEKIFVKVKKNPDVVAKSIEV